MILTDIVQVNADNANVLSGRISENPPPWATAVRVQFAFSDYDCLFDAKLGDQELARDSMAHRHAADNTAQPDWSSPHIYRRIPGGGREFEMRIGVDETTAGEGFVVVQFEGPG
jgi:hypothetical protein